MFLENLSEYKIQTPSGLQSFKGIQKVSKDRHWHIILDNDIELKSSHEHLFLTDTGLKCASNIGRNEHIISDDEDRKVIYSEDVNEEIELYDIVEVDDGNLFYSNDIVSHNCSFLGSSNTLISTEKLLALPYKTPVYTQNGLDVYQEPVIGNTYVMVCDVARGVGLDYSAFSVFDVTQQPYRQVAKYRKNDISPMLYPNVIFTTAEKYNEAFVLVEVNDIGQQVADILYHDMEYENMMMVTMHGRNGQQIGGGFSKNVSMGIRTTKQVKRIGCATLKDLIERDNLLIEDFDTISELTTFIGKSTSWEADDGAHDDLVMCCVLFSWLVQQRYFRELTDQDIREKMFAEQMKMIEEEMVPFGFIENGHDPDENSIPGDDNLWAPAGQEWQKEYY